MTKIKNTYNIISINVKHKTYLLKDHANKQAKLIAYMSKFKANQEHAYAIGIQSSSQVVVNPPIMNSFDIFSHDIAVVNDIKRLTHAVAILSDDLEKQRNMFMFVSFKRNKNLQALPKNILNYCEVKYPSLVS